MSKSSFEKPKGETVSDVQVVEQVRSALPILAEPFAPGEKLAAWIDRASRACGVPAARLRSYWHRKVEKPGYSEVTAVFAAHNKALARKQDLARLQSQLETLRHELVAEANPRLVALVPGEVAGEGDQEGGA